MLSITQPKEDSDEESITDKKSKIKKEGPLQITDDDSGSTGSTGSTGIESDSSSVISETDHAVTPVTPVSSSNISNSRKRKRGPTGPMLVADALRDLAKSAKQVQKDAGRSGWKMNKLEEAMMLLQGDGMMEDEDLITASEFFKDEQNATIFCSFKKDLRYLWLKKQLAMAGAQSG